MQQLPLGMPDSAGLETFLPAAAGQEPIARLQRRSALAEARMVGLELSRDGAAVLDQDAAFGGIVVRPGVAGGIPTVQATSA